MIEQFQPYRPMKPIPFSRKLPTMVGRRPKTADTPHHLREMRLARPGVTLDMIAEKLGSNPQTVQRVELGVIELKVRDLPRYAEALGVDGAEILGYERLFRDPQKLKLLQAYDRLPAEDRDKLVRMAEAMAPAILITDKVTGKQALLQPSPASTSIIDSQSGTGGFLVAANAEIARAAVAHLTADTSRRAEVQGALNYLAKSRGLTVKTIQQSVTEGVDRAIAESGRNIALAERNAMIEDAILMASAELQRSRPPTNPRAKSG